MANQERDTSTATLERPAPAPVNRLPQWNVLLHNDEKNEMGDVVESITMLTPLKRPEAIERMLEAHKRGIALLMTTHREHAELVAEQFQSRRLTVTVEPGR